MANPNAQLSRKWFEDVWNRRRAATIDEMLAPESVGHLENGDVVGIDAFKAVHAEYLQSFPNLSVVVEGIVADGDDVVVRWLASGCHSGDGFGIKATKQCVSFRGMTWHRYRDGKLIEGWDCWNQMALLEQLRSAEQHTQSAREDAP